LYQPSRKNKEKLDKKKPSVYVKQSNVSSNAGGEVLGGREVSGTILRVCFKAYISISLSNKLASKWTNRPRPVPVETVRVGYCIMKTCRRACWQRLIDSGRSLPARIGSDPTAKHTSGEPEGPCSSPEKTPIEDEAPVWARRRIYSQTETMGCLVSIRKVPGPVAGITTQTVKATE
jgi:hypothetical protein